ncbi:MAG: hypothetical protein P4M01_14405 [Acidobacteriota bacterium]|nr:hypothetical protein [Acidobacteriota bacterium]
MSGGYQAMEAAARAMLHSLGAGPAALVVTQATTASGTDGLGLLTPVAVEVELSPLLVQATVNGQELLAITTHAAASRALNGLTGTEARLALLRSQLRVQETVYRITAVTVKYFGGTALMVELGIEE